VDIENNSDEDEVEQAKKSLFDEISNMKKSIS